MPPRETIASDLVALKMSTCFGPDAAQARCPNRVTGTPHGGTGGDARVAGGGACPRCSLARERILVFVTERAWRVARGVCHPEIRDDAVSEVVAEYLRRLQNGRLLRRWEPGRPVWSIASRAFLRKRLISAGQAVARLRSSETLFSVAGVEVEGLDSAPLNGAGSGEDSAAADRLRLLIRAGTWTGGRAVEIVAALQLFSHLAGDIAANRPLIAALGRVLRPRVGSVDPLSFLAAYHAQKARESEAELDRLADQLLRSRARSRVQRLQRVMDQLHAQIWLSPLSASDLQLLLGLSRANADKRMERYRAYLRQVLDPGPK